MTLGRFHKYIGFGLLVVSFGIALARLYAPRGVANRPTDDVVIRFAHWELHHGLREAFDALVQDYERLHPGVKVEQMALPARVYPMWLNSQLIGGTAPDLMELGSGLRDHHLVRYFQPITEFIAAPNPYNIGTPLEGVPWRHTFIDGAAAIPAYNERLMEQYGVPMTLFTYRIYYNADLMREIFGEVVEPRSYREFVAMAREIKNFSRDRGRELVPVAGSKTQADMFMQRLYESQTQTLARELDRMRILRNDNLVQALGYLRGDWSLESEPVQTGLELMRESAGFMGEGFLQAANDDATFHFLQGRAVMIGASSADATSLLGQTAFSVGVFPFPFPGADDPKYGRFPIGRITEGGENTQAAFGLNRRSRHPAVALDFLHFITSRRGQEVFVQESGWLPSVATVEVRADMKKFLPVVEGYPPGVSLRVLQFGFYDDIRREIETRWHLLLGESGSVRSFVDELKPVYRRALYSGVKKMIKDRHERLIRSDTVLAAEIWLADEPPNLKTELMVEAQLRSEVELLWADHELAAVATGP